MAAGTLPLGSRFAWAQSYPSGPVRAAEAPALSLGDDTKLVPGMVSPEPYLDCPTGAREHIEEVIVVTEDRCDILSRGADKPTVVV
jgi:Xaa-Pro aminopeptidase